MIVADILLLAVALTALIIASIIDIKIKEVPDWLNFSLVAIALGIRLIHAIIFSAWSYFLYGALGFAAMFALGLILFYTRQWGGGDTKLLMGMGAVFGTRPFFIEPTQFPFLAILLINLLLVGALYGLVWVIILFIKNRKNVLKESRRLFVKKKAMRYIYPIFAIALFIPVFIIDILMLKIFFTAMAIFLFVYPYLFILIKAVENVGMLKYVSPKELIEGDWVAERIKVRGKTICSSKDLGLDKKQIIAIKRAKIKKVLIKEGIAFVPSFLLGTIITLIIGNFLFFLFLTALT